MADQWYRRAFGAHYPLLYGHRDEAEAARCLELLPRLAPLADPVRPGSGRILDLGCGQGRHLAQLALGPIPAVGLDLSMPLLESARRRWAAGTGAPLVRADMLALPFGDAVFSAVLSLFTAFGYFGSLGQNRPLVHQIARVLTLGGHWYLDYLDADQVREELGDQEAQTRTRNAGPFAVSETRVLSPEADRVIKTVTVQPRPGCSTAAAAVDVPPAGLTYQEQVALFTVPELDEMAEELGLERVAEAGNYRGDPLGRGDRWILVYRRRRADFDLEVPDAV